MADAKKGGSDKLTCVVCLDRFKEPKILPCGHTFCKSCLEGFPLKRQKLTCPQCRTEHAVPEGGFLIDFSAEREIEFESIKESASKNTPCGLCSESKQPLAAFCGECDTTLCDYCTEAHKRMKPFRDHETVPLEELSLQSFKPKSKPHYCHQHHDKIVQFYCETCKQLICNECAVPRSLHTRLCSVHKSHHSHTFYSLADAVKTTNAEVNELMTSAESTVSNCTTGLKEIQEIEKELESLPDELRVIVNASIDSCIKLLQTRRTQLLKELDDMFSEKKKQLCHQKEAMKTTLGTLTRTLHFGKKSLKCPGDDERLLVNIEILRHYGNSAGKTFQGCQVTQPPVMFQNPEEEVKRMHCRPLSGKDVEVFIHDPATSFSKPQRQRQQLQLRSQSVKLGSKVQLEVVMPKCAAVGKPQFQIQYNPSSYHPPVYKCSLHPKTTHKSDNTWLLEFTPVCDGYHRVMFCVRGGWIDKDIPTFMVIGAPPVSAVVRKGPDWVSKVSSDDKENTGRVISSSACKSRRKNLIYYIVTVKWSGMEETTTYHWGGGFKYEIELVPQ